MSSLADYLDIAHKLTDRVAAMDWLVFVIAALSAAVGYTAAVMFHHRQITAQREGNRVVLQMERKELSKFMRYVQSIASNVDEKVDRHSTSLTSINHDLGRVHEPDPKAVLRAVKQLFEANLHLHGELTSAQEQIDYKQQQIESYMAEARTDKLTGIPNRRAFDEHIYRLFSAKSTRRGSFCLLLADVDHFKLFNDYHGHQVGDEMLLRVATTIKKSLRSKDIVCRYGGEEFAILLPRTKLADALRIAERARAAVQALVSPIAEAELQVTISIGVVELLRSEEIPEFIKRGDEALYAAKLAGRNCVRHEPNRASQRLDQILAEVGKAAAESDSSRMAAGNERRINA
ncbi:MAG: diguanylate cyclase [Planctomycetaceae bacterium]